MYSLNAISLQIFKTFVLFWKQAVYYCLTNFAVFFVGLKKTAFYSLTTFAVFCRQSSNLMFLGFRNLTPHYQRSWSCKRRFCLKDFIFHCFTLELKRVHIANSKVYKGSYCNFSSLRWFHIAIFKAWLRFFLDFFFCQKKIFALEWNRSISASFKDF